MDVSEEQTVTIFRVSQKQARSKLQENCQLDAPIALPPGREPSCYVVMRLGGPCSRSGPCKVEKIFCPRWESNSDSSARRLDWANPAAGEADNLLPSFAVVKNRWNYTSSPPYVIAWCLIKHFIFRKCTVRISTGKPTILRSFMTFLTSSRKRPGLGYDCFLPNPFQSTLHLSYHLTLCNLASCSVVK
jgi:hypothetical protein